MTNKLPLNLQPTKNFYDGSSRDPWDKPFDQPAASLIPSTRVTDVQYLGRVSPSLDQFRRK